MLKWLLLASIILSCFSCRSNRVDSRVDQDASEDATDMQIKREALNGLNDKLISQSNNGSSKYIDALKKMKSEYDANEYLLKNHFDYVQYYERKHKDYWTTKIELGDLSSESKLKLLDTINRRNPIEDMLTKAIWNTAQNHIPK